MNNAVYSKTMENLRNRIDAKLVRRKKYYMKRTSKPSYMFQKIFENDLVAIPRYKVILTLNKPGYVDMCTLDLCKVLMYEFHCDYIKKSRATSQYYYSQTLKV